MTAYAGGVQVNISSYSQALHEVEQLVALRHNHYVCFFEGNMFHLTLRRPDVVAALNGAALVYPDGVAVAYAQHLDSGLEIQRVSGPTFILKACEYGVPRHWRHFFLGGTPQSLSALVDNLASQFPGLEVVGRYSPPFRPMTPDEDRALIDEINAANADLLWVGLGGPKQEFWLQAHQGKLNVPVMLGVGAAFDFHSGRRAWAPAWVRSIGCEWFYRMLCGGQRIFWRNLLGVTDVFLWLLRRRIVVTLMRWHRNKPIQKRPR